jgi:energy-coupling factor transport system ATP-binding protein
MSGVSLGWDEVRAAYVPGAEVLHGVTVHVGPGEAVALLGPNGAGKTTLTRLLMGLVRPRSGRVHVGDWEVAGRRPDEMARRVGYAFQHADQQLFARSVRDDVAFGPRQLGLATAPVDDVLAELGLAAVAARHPYDLPAPVRKLVALAGVLAMRTPALVLDEPTAGFGDAAREVVLAALRRRVASGTTLVAISHDLAFVRAIASREIQLVDGRVVSDTPRRATG